MSDGIDIEQLKEALERWESHLAGIHDCVLEEPEAVAVLIINEAARLVADGEVIPLADIGFDAADVERWTWAWRIHSGAVPASLADTLSAKSLLDHCFDKVMPAAAVHLEGTE